MSHHAPSSRNPLVDKLELFATLSNADKIAIEQAASLRVRDVEANEDIIREGEKPDHVNLVLDGRACRQKQLEDGRRQILAYFLPGDLCDLKVFILKKMDHSISAITPVRIAEIPHDTVIDLVDNGSRLARAFWWSAMVAESIEREWIVNLGQRSAFERVGHLFCELFIRLKAIGLADNDTCEMPLTQTKLGDTTGLSTVHIIARFRSCVMRTSSSSETASLRYPISAVSSGFVFSPRTTCISTGLAKRFI